MFADFNEIYNLLFAGKKVQLDFAHDKDAEYFRTRFAKFKARQETNLLSSGFMSENDVPTFSFLKDKTTASWTALFIPRRKPTVFKILVLDNEQ